MNFTNIIYECRKASNISQDTLAAELDISRRTIGKIERGEQNPSLDIAYRLSVYFGKSIEEMFPRIS